MKKGLVTLITIVLTITVLACERPPIPTPTPASPITVLSPNGGETFIAGKPIPFSWKWSGGTGPIEPAIYLYSVEREQIIYGSLSDIHYEPKSGIQMGNFNALSYYRIINGKPDGYPPDFIPGGRYKIKIAEYPENTNNPRYPAAPPQSDYSDNSFVINAPSEGPPPPMTVRLSATNPASIRPGNRVPVFRFDVTAASQDVSLKEVYFGFFLDAGGAIASAQNFILFDGSTLLAQGNNLNPQLIRFSFLGAIPAGSTKTFTIAADISGPDGTTLKMEMTLNDPNDPIPLKLTRQILTP